MAGCLAVGYYICYHNQFKLFPIVIDSYSITDFMNNYYYKPWCRAPPYLFGLYLGILYKEYMNKQKECDEKKTVNDTLLARIKRKMIEAPTYRYSCYVIGLFLVLFLTFFPRQIQIDEGAWSETFILIWLTFQRLLFVLGLNLILLPSLIVSKDIIAKILAWNVFGVITKISFGMYLVHYFIIERSMLGVRQATYYTSESILYFYFTDVFFTILVAAILSLCVEIPFINLEKFIKGDKKIREKKQTPSPS